MPHILMLTDSADTMAQVLPALEFLSHRVQVVRARTAEVLQHDPADLHLLDARKDLAGARTLARLLKSTGSGVPLIAVVTEGAMAAVSAEWMTDDVVLDSAGPAEVEARLRIALGRTGEAGNRDQPGAEIRAAGIVVNEDSYTARINGAALNLTYKEFELLKYLAQHPGRVFTRDQLLQEVWGYDYFGGTRTVDVHIRRLRAKLGADHETLIGTVRNVGYRFAPPRTSAAGSAGMSEVSAG